MSEEKDEATMAEASPPGRRTTTAAVWKRSKAYRRRSPPRTNGPERKAVPRRQAWGRANLHPLPKSVQEAILESLKGAHKYPTHELPDQVGAGRHHGDDVPTATMTTPC